MPRKRPTLLPALTLALILGVGAPMTGAFAQEATALPPPPPGKPGAADPLELLPAIGRIGAAVGFQGGWSRNPYSLGSGAQGAGFLNLPLKKLGGGVLSYELVVRFARSTSDPITITDPLAFVANLAATGRGNAGPFPYQRVVRSVGSILLVEPVGFKYAIHSFGRFRPYAVAGVGVGVVLTRETPEASLSLTFSGAAPFDANLIAGLVAQSKALEALGRPTGQGNVEVAGHVGAGFEYRLSPGLSFQADYRFTRLSGRNSSMQVASGGFGIHF
jgi:opacity protein-like surface antigen